MQYKICISQTSTYTTFNWKQEKIIALQRGDLKLIKLKLIVIRSHVNRVESGRVWMKFTYLQSLSLPKVCWLYFTTAVTTSMSYWRNSAVNLR